MNTINFLAPRGNLISVTIAGDGPTMILLHGFPLDHRQWLPQLRHLSAYYRVIVPELRGFGRSTLTEQDYSIAELAEDVEQVRLHFAPEQTIVLGGLSMGGYVALEYWRQFAPRLSGLILANTKPDADAPAAREARLEMVQRAQRSGSWAAVSGMLPKLLTAENLSARAEIFNAVESMLQSCSVAAVTHAQTAMAERQDFIHHLPAITTPTLVLTGEQDSIAPPEATRKWAAVIPNSTCHVLPPAAHLTPLEAADEFNQRVHEFVQHLS